MLVAATAQSDAFPSRRSGLAPSPTTPLVVFLAGFPDDTRSFDAVAPAFEGTHAVLKLALPGYEGAPLSERWGLSFKVLIEKMHDAVAEKIREVLHRSMLADVRDERRAREMVQAMVESGPTSIKTLAKKKVGEASPLSLRAY